MRMLVAHAFGRPAGSKSRPSGRVAASASNDAASGWLIEVVYVQVLFQDGKFQWKRLENLISLAKEGSGGLDLSDTVRDGARVLLLDQRLRGQLILALTEDNRLHLEVCAALLSVRTVSQLYIGALRWQYAGCHVILAMLGAQPLA